MCFIAKCPYVPPHSYNIDFPHLMLRYRAVENKEKNEPYIKGDKTKNSNSETELELKSTGKELNFLRNFNIFLYFCYF